MKLNCKTLIGQFAWGQKRSSISWFLLKSRYWCFLPCIFLFFLINYCSIWSPKNRWCSKMRSVTSKLEYIERKPSAYLKIWKTQSKMPKYKNFFTSFKNWCPQLIWKLNEAISPKILISSKQMKIDDVFYRFISKAHSAA